MQTTQAKSTLEMRTSSAANSLRRLRTDIQDAMVDFWHHPGIANSALDRHAQRVQVHLQVLLNPMVLQPAHADQSQRDIADICAWLQSHAVTYEIGHAPVLFPLQAKPKDSNGLHHLVLTATFGAER